jgi:cell division protein FtsQ
MRSTLHLGLVCGLVGGVLGGFVWLISSGRAGNAVGWLETHWVDISAHAGYRLEEVLVEGRAEARAEDLLDALNVARGDPILAIDLKASREALEKTPWVASASIERRLPGTLYVRLKERQPLALWQNNRRMVVIDRRGRVLAEDGLGRFAHLPIVIGPEAPANTLDLLTKLATEPKVQERMTSASWVGNRRWDLHLDNGITVRLPERDLAGALKRLAEAVASHDLLARDVSVIDLRLPDRLVVQTTTAAVPPRPKTKGEKI